MSDFPVVTVEVAFVSDPLDDTPTFTDVTEYARSVSTRCGRSEQFAAYDPGVATVVLDNTTREFDPLHAGGPHASNLLPNKKIRIKATWDGDEFELFTGHVDGWPQSYDSDGESFSTVVAPDAFKLLDRRRLPDYYAHIVTADSPRMWYRLNETEGLVFNDSSGNDRDMSSSLPVGEVATEGMIQFADAGINLTQALDAQIPAEHFSSFNPCTIEFWFYAENPPPSGGGRLLFSRTNNGTQNVGQTVFVYTTGGWLTAEFFEPSGAAVSATTVRSNGYGIKVTDGRPHHVVVTRDGTTIRIYIDGSDRTGQVFTSGTMTGLPVALPVDLNVIQVEDIQKWDGDARLDELAIYDDDLSAGDVLAHYQAGVNLWNGQRTGERAANVLDLVNWPSALYDVDTGQSYLGPAVWDDNTSALDYLRLLEATEQGALYCDHANGGVVRFRSRTDFLTNVRSTTNQGVYSDNDGDAGFVIRYSHLDLAYDDSEIVNRVDVEWVGGTVTAIDQTSIDTYEEQSRTITTLMPTKADAESLASWVLDHYKDAFVRVKSLTINPSAQTGASAELAWEGCLRREIGDRILVVRHPHGIGTEFSQAVIIEGIEHTIEDGVSWSTTFRCGPAELNEYWILGTSELGSETRLSF